MDYASNLIDRFRARDADVAVIGLGYVGLPLVWALHEAGYRVVGVDVDPEKVRKLGAGEPYLKHLGEDLHRGLASSTRFRATTEEAEIGGCDAVLICVPTPLTRDRKPDLSYVLRTAEAVGRHAAAGALVVLESTTYPGTTREELVPALRRGGATGARIGEDLFVAYSPEREDPGRRDHSTRTIPKLVGGLDGVSTDVACALYGGVVERVVRVGSAEVAEAAKLLENVFRAVNIALVNELKTVLDALGVDIWEVIEAASTKPFGYMPFYPGPGLGGHCIPIDPFYLAWRAERAGVPARFIELAGEVNRAMPERVIGRVVEALSVRGVAIRGARVLVMGLAYKPDVDDVRESPSFVLIERLEALGAVVSYSDPHVPETPDMRHHDVDLESVALTPESVASFDAVLIATAHGAFDYGMIAERARLVVDTRDAMRAYEGGMGDRLVRA